MRETLVARIKSMRKVDKPWGHELIVEHTSKYALKEIVLKEGTRSSLQSHDFKLETILVLDGSVELETWDENKVCHRETYGPGEAYTVQPRQRHRVRAVQTCRLIEVSTPELDDVIRYDDDFGRL